MQIIKINYCNPDLVIIKKVAKAISEGKIAVVPGDAVYTIVGDAFNLDVIKRIYTIKKREKVKPFNLGLYSLEDITKYSYINPLPEEIIKKYPNEPFTFIVPRKECVPSFLNPGYKTLGFRIPFNKVTSTLSKLHRNPIIGTSANISELKNTYSVEELMEYFKGVFGHKVLLDIVLDAGKLPFRRPSTVIELTNHDVNIIREGEISSLVLKKEIKELKENFNKKIYKKQ